MPFASKEKKKEYDIAYRERNKGHSIEEERARWAAYYITNRKRILTRQAAYYTINRERRKASTAAWKADNPEKKKANDAAWRNRNKDRVRMNMVEWRAKNSDKIRAQVAAWAAENPERIRELHAAWKKRNPGYGKIKNHNRRARKKSNGGKLSKDIISKLTFLQRWKCAICKTSLKKTGYHIDHIIPLARGGINSDRNVQLTCPTCNQKKHAKDPIQFMREMGYLL